MRYNRIGYNINLMRQFVCLVINPITVDSLALVLHAACSCIRLSDGPNIKLVALFKMVGTRLSLVCFSVSQGSTGGFLLLQYFSGVVSYPRVLQMSQ